ncbi:histidine phosphatase family protein [Thermomonospora catenispora]|uniref:histidine phosphatase family protein n=1 Tax=Thermomonospora catenispora TaxID=2493090 RepID=UPI00111D669F|nr:histidine phosphatase family protein [Thermomonospora catenispora]TNY37075.1 histidine phosphatase family protein [Thermomonospora catenispora]
MDRVRNLEALIATRHGESMGNVAHKAAQQAPERAIERVDIADRDADVPLSERGRAQAAALGRRLAALPDEERPTVVLCSPYLRALDTAEIALSALGDPPELLVDERLRDREQGVLHGLTEHGIRVRHPEEAERRERIGKFYYRPPGGESWADVILRLRSVYNDADLDFPGERVLVVAHDAVVVLTRYIIERLTESQVLEIESQPVANCSFSRWIRRDGRLRPAEYNDTAHLAEPTAAPERTAAPS